MADIKISRNHNLQGSELQTHRETLADEMAKKFGIRRHFRGNRVHLSGGALRNGAVTWSSDTVTIELTLGYMSKFFKSQIEKEIETRLHALL